MSSVRIQRLLALFSTLLLMSWPSTSMAQEETRLLRFPHIHGNSVVFTYAGDLYTASIEGGEAKRLHGRGEQLLQGLLCQ